METIMTLIDRPERTRSRLLNNIARAGIAALAVCSVALSSGAAAADSSSKTPTLKVFYGDLNLERPEGAAALYRRLRAAADTVCSPVDSTQPDWLRRFEDCMRKSIADAVAKVDNPVLTAYYQSKNPRHALPPVVTAKN
jgi:UrcA family protein